MEGRVGPYELGRGFRKKAILPNLYTPLDSLILHLYLFVSLIPLSLPLRPHHHRSLSVTLVSLSLSDLYLFPCISFGCVALSSLLLDL